MVYAQIKGGRKLHLACIAGEQYRGEIVRAGYISAPLCRTSAFKGRYRMTINVSLGYACRTCLKQWRALLAETEAKK